MKRKEGRDRIYSPTISRKKKLSASEGGKTAKLLVVDSQEMRKEKKKRYDRSALLHQEEKRREWEGILYYGHRIQKEGGGRKNFKGKLRIGIQEGEGKTNLTF